MNNKTINLKLGIIGLGYVGLPLHLNLQNIFKRFNFDVHKKRINEIISGI